MELWWAEFMSISGKLIVVNLLIALIRSWRIDGGLRDFALHPFMRCHTRSRITMLREDLPAQTFRVLRDFYAGLGVSLVLAALIAL